MPFSRPQFFDLLVEGMVGQGVELRLLCDSRLSFWMPEWVKLWEIQPPIPRRPSQSVYPTAVGSPSVNPGNWAVDKFLDHAVQKEPDFFSTDHWVSFMTDDNCWSWNYWSKVNAALRMHRPAVMLRAFRHFGGVVVATWHAKASVLWERGTAHCFNTAFEALTCRADLLKDKRLGKLWCADGVLVERLCEENPESVACFNAGLVYREGLFPEKWGAKGHNQPEAAQ